LVLFLVFVGGIVRSTGAGMGCPDWPKCFGSWVPPTSADQVPLQYWSDPLSSKDGFLIFNPVKTWTEYLNRLLGVVIGFSIFLQLVFSFRGKVPYLARIFSILSFIMVVFQGWLGAKVVSTDLRPLVITIHLVVALLIGLSLLFSLFFTGSPGNNSMLKPKSSLAWWVMGLLMVQFFLGTEVRAQVDVLFKQFAYENRFAYADALDWKFWIHRSFSLLALVLMVYQVFHLGRYLAVGKVGLVFLPLLLTLGLMFTGLILVYLGFPAFIQPFHLVFGFAIICSQCWLLMHLHFANLKRNVVG
jgi:cytochrome c oxidase assembly protein subunit 15